MKPSLICLAACTAMIAACASTSEPPAGGPTPAQIVSSGEAHGDAHWGGQIVSLKNLRERTLVEVLALPLAGDGRPRVNGRPQGRFIVDHPGFLEPHEYVAGRLLEVHGQLHGFSEGTVGDAPYRYPVVRAGQLTLWPDDGARYPGPSSPRINFGIGVSNQGSGVGVGIGF